MHKYGLWQSASNTQHMLYFCTADDSRKSKMIFPSVHKYRNTDTNTRTNTHIQLVMKYQKDPAMYAISFLIIQLKNTGIQINNEQLMNWLLHGPPRFIELRHGQRNEVKTESGIIFRLTNSLSSSSLVVRPPRLSNSDKQTTVEKMDDEETDRAAQFRQFWQFW